MACMGVEPVDCDVWGGDESVYEPMQFVRRGCDACPSRDDSDIGRRGELLARSLTWFRRQS
jgi:hypothetical protein